MSPLSDEGSAQQMNSTQQYVGTMRPAPLRLACGQIWSGNRDDANVLELPGLSAWVYSKAAGSGKAGGDVYYVSVCPRCQLSRIALADVSGHGEAVARVGTHLGTMMERHLQAIKQVPLMTDLSRAVRQELGGEHYATMVAMGWHGRWGIVALSNAGHPSPLWFSTARGGWSWLESKCAPEQIVDLPLGLLDVGSYDAVALKSRPGDVFVLYSDGISEMLDPAGNELGRSTLMDLVQPLDCASAEQFGLQLVAALDDFRGSTPQLDDQTIIVVRRNAELRRNAPPF